MSEWLARLPELIAAFAASDPSCKRFGAARHRYELLPPVSARDLPADYLEYVTKVSAGGVGPYHGLLPVDRTIEIAAPSSLPWQRALAICHLGCGYLALLALDGDAPGEIWIDARALHRIAPIYDSFTELMVDWIDRVANNRWLDGHVEPGQCAATAALSGYLALCESRLGLAAGTLAGDQLRDALAALGPGAIEVTASDNPLFDPGDRVDVCVTCARALHGLGVSADVVAAGVAPRPGR